MRKKQRFSAGLRTFCFKARSGTRFRLKPVPIGAFMSAITYEDPPSKPGRRQVRGGQRIPMYEHALAPLRNFLTQGALQDLVLALSAASGVESYIALKDACRADDETARRISVGLIDGILDRVLDGSRSQP